MSDADHEFVILDRAERRALPVFITDDSIAPRVIFSELIKAGLLSGQELRGPDGLVEIAKPTITHAGRQQLIALRDAHHAKTLTARARKWTRALLVFLAGIGATLLAQWLSKLLNLGK